MALADLMALNKKNIFNQKVGMSEERIKEVIPIIRQFVSF